jgi:hypothetical protein
MSLAFCPLTSTFASDTIVAAEPAAKHLLANDCVAKVVNNSQMLQVKTKNGLDYTIFRDSLKRAEVVRINGKSYRVLYDQNLPNKISSIKSLDTGEVTSVKESLAKFVAPGDKEKVMTFVSKIKLCDAHGVSSAKAGDGGMTTQGFEGDDGGGGHDDMPHDMPENWEAAGFASEWTDELWWEEDMAPEASGWAEDAFAISRDETRACVDRYSGCNDVCDFQSDARSVSCAIGALIWIELPVGSALYGIACMGASWYHKLQCKAVCGNLSSCF